MSTSSLELKMSSNLVHKTVSFQAAENLREEAERTVRNIANAMNAGGSFPAGSGYYNVAAGDKPPAVDTSSFWNNNPSNYIASSSGGYVIEHLGQKAIVLDDRTTTRNMQVFRLTVRGVGNDGISETLTQAMYMKN